MIDPPRAEADEAEVERVARELYAVFDPSGVMLEPSVALLNVARWHLAEVERVTAERDEAHLRSYAMTVKLGHVTSLLDHASTCVDRACRHESHGPYVDPDDAIDCGPVCQVPT